MFCAKILIFCVLLAALAEWSSARRHSIARHVTDKRHSVTGRKGVKDENYLEHALNNVTQRIRRESQGKKQKRRTKGEHKKTETVMNAGDVLKINSENKQGKTSLKAVAEKAKAKPDAKRKTDSAVKKTQAKDKSKKGKTKAAVTETSPTPIAQKAEAKPKGKKTKGKAQTKETKKPDKKNKKTKKTKETKKPDKKTQKTKKTKSKSNAKKTKGNSVTKKGESKPESRKSKTKSVKQKSSKTKPAAAVPKPGNTVPNVTTFSLLDPQPKPKKNDTEELNMCDIEECYNGGTCRPDEGTLGYTCKCPPGIIGDKCEYIIQTCDLHPCQNGATCRAKKTPATRKYFCVCTPLYTGELCEVSIAVQDGKSGKMKDLFEEQEVQEQKKENMIAIGVTIAILFIMFITCYLIYYIIKKKYPKKKDPATATPKASSYIQPSPLEQKKRESKQEFSKFQLYCPVISKFCMGIRDAICPRKRKAVKQVPPLQPTLKTPTSTVSLMGAKPPSSAASRGPVSQEQMNLVGQRQMGVLSQPHMVPFPTSATSQAMQGGVSQPPLFVPGVVSGVRPLYWNSAPQGPRGMDRIGPSGPPPASASGLPPGTSAATASLPKMP